MKVQLDLRWFPPIIAIIVIIVLVLDWLRWIGPPIIVPVCQISGNSPWPMQPGVPKDLGNLYLQLNEDRSLHLGVDIVSPVGSKVYAIEDGVIVARYEAGGHYDEITVESSSTPGKATTYTHLASMTKKVEGESVDEGEELGLVAPFDPYVVSPGTYDHLHLERDEPDPGGVSSDGIWESFHAAENPLKRLSLPGDTHTPLFLPTTASAVRPGNCESSPYLALAENRPDGWLSGSRTFVCPGELEAGKNYDIIVRVDERPFTGSNWVNRPFCLMVRITSVADGVLDFSTELRFDGPQGNPSFAGPPDFVFGGANDLLLTEAPIVGQRDFYLVATNQVYSDGFWKPEAIGGVKTEYELVVEAADSTGTKTTVTQLVTVHP